MCVARSKVRASTRLGSGGGAGVGRKRNTTHLALVTMDQHRMISSIQDGHQRSGDLVFRYCQCRARVRYRIRVWPNGKCKAWVRAYAERGNGMGRKKRASSRARKRDITHFARTVPTNVDVRSESERAISHDPRARCVQRRVVCTRGDFQLTLLPGIPYWKKVIPLSSRNFVFCSGYSSNMSVLSRRQRRVDFSVSVLHPSHRARRRVP